MVVELVVVDVVVLVVVEVVGGCMVVQSGISTGLIDSVLFDNPIQFGTRDHMTSAKVSSVLLTLFFL